MSCGFEFNTRDRIGLLLLSNSPVDDYSEHLMVANCNCSHKAIDRLDLMPANSGVSFFKNLLYPCCQVSMYIL